MIKTESTTEQNDETMADMHALFDKIDFLQKQIEQLKGQKSQSTDQDGSHQMGDSASVTEGSQESSTTVSTADIIVPNDSLMASDSFSSDPLAVIPHNPESIIVLMNWLQYLIDQCGYQNLDIILEYYVDINWITDDVKLGLLDYSKGIKKENMKTTTKSGSSRDAKEQTILPSRDHIQSYMFIQKLKGKKFDKHFVDKIQNDLTRLRNKIDQYQQ
jgi:flagellar protein FlaD